MGGHSPPKERFAPTKTKTLLILDRANPNSLRDPFLHAPGHRNALSAGPKTSEGEAARGNYCFPRMNFSGKIPFGGRGCAHLQPKLRRSALCPVRIRACGEISRFDTSFSSGTMFVPKCVREPPESNWPDEHLNARHGQKRHRPFVATKFAARRNRCGRRRICGGGRGGAKEIEKNGRRFPGRRLRIPSRVGTILPLSTLLLATSASCRRLAWRRQLRRSHNPIPRDIAITSRIVPSR